MGNDDALGLYRCTPYNSYGTAGESRPTRVLLKVSSPSGTPPPALQPLPSSPRRPSALQDPPAFTVRPKEEYFQEVGRELVIPCAAHGDPPPTITWVKVGAAALGGSEIAFGL